MSGMRRWTACLVACSLASCWRSSPRPPPRHTPVLVSHDRDAVKRDRPGAVYNLDEALADAFSSPWTFVGTGEWFGMFKVNACVYRNDRVFIVNIYCTLKEKRAFGLVVLSPTRGRAHIYAEGERPISETRRPDWMTFKGEANIAVVDDRVPALRLDFTYTQLREWDEKRYYRHSAGCFGGVEIKRPQGGCLHGLDDHAAAWAARNKAFFDAPNDDWYRMVKEMRARVVKDARPYRDP